MNCIFNLNFIRSADLSAFNNDGFKKFKQPTATDPSLFIPEIPDPDLTCIFGFQHSISRIKAKQVRFVNVSCTLNQYLGLARLRCQPIYWFTCIPCAQKIIFRGETVSIAVNFFVKDISWSPHLHWLCLQAQIMTVFLFYINQYVSKSSVIRSSCAIDIVLLDHKQWSGLLTQSLSTHFIQ